MWTTPDRTRRAKSRTQVPQSGPTATKRKRTRVTAPPQEKRQLPEPYVSTCEVAEFLGKPESWIYDKAGPLGMPRHRLGNHYRYRLSEVANWVASQ